MFIFQVVLEGFIEIKHELPSFIEQLFCPVVAMNMNIFFDIFGIVQILCRFDFLFVPFYAYLSKLVLIKRV